MSSDSSNTASRWQRVVPGWMRSIRFRITFTAVLVTTALLAVTGWLLTLSIEDTQLTQIRQQTEASLDDIVERLESGDDPAAALREPAPTALVQILDDEGDVMASAIGTAAVTSYVVSTHRATSGELDPFEDRPTDDTGGDSSMGHPEPPPDPRTSVVVEHGSIDRDFDLVDARQASVAIQVADERGDDVERLAKSASTDDGQRHVVAYAPIDEVGRNMSAVRRALFVAAPGLIALAAVLTWFLVGRSLRPVETIRSEVEAIGGSTIDRRVPERGAHDEVGKLARTMNAMLDRLDRSSRRQREFISDASHELRSPITSIRTNLEVALRQPDTTSWPDVAREALADEARLEALLDDLLLLAAADEGCSRKSTVQVDVVALAHDEANVARPFPAEVSVEAPTGPVDVDAAPPELRRVLTNLVDNATRHADAQVRIGLSLDDDVVRIDVDDDGAGIPAAHRERIFERFVRLDEGRSRDDGGTGLGLAVVRSIVARHGGTTEVSDSPLGGARFTVLLPAVGQRSERAPAH